MALLLQLSKRLSHCPTPGVLPGICLRTFQGPSDVATWLDLRHRAFARAQPGVQQWDAGDFAAEFQAKPWWSPDRLWFAEVLDPESGLPRAVGSVALADREVAESVVVPAVHWLAVLPMWRRRGVGRLLLAVLEERAWQLGHREVFLETHAGWSAAGHLYEALGYQPVPGVPPMS